MTLRQLISLLPRATVSGPLDVEIAGITSDSRKVVPGMVFVAVRGTATDGRQYIPAAIRDGAVAIISEAAPTSAVDPGLAWLHVPDARKALAVAASAWENDPWSSLMMVGITGTNGKTTTAFLIHHLMKSEWHRAGLLGTVTVDDGEIAEPATHTTPGPEELESLLARMRDNGCRGVAMEVSSHGIDQNRVFNIGFDAAVFTNLTQDHLDYHGTMENYFAAKKAWFDMLCGNPNGKKPVAVVNLDDEYGADLVAALDGRMPVLTYGFGVRSVFRANHVRQTPRGTEFELTAKGRTYLVRTPLIGRFNVYNTLAALAAASAVGIRPREAVAAIASTPQVPGRMEYVGMAEQVTAFVDYAHTPDALESACRTMRELQPGRLITVFGCGGDRDRGKRPLMAAAAARHSDACVITSDNPRGEDPQTIIREIEAGMGGAPFVSIMDREEAIRSAITAAGPGDIVLIAGKGHETYQQFADHVADFDDRKVAWKCLRERSETVER
jgi:UDP-N-acetylmuramoyl-L-alanyl-D-glutamate--2,6-diaminopimelate ligase